jgi:VIT1/CCC1 family predicted Fe2+/Mn2+ transporter
MDGSARTHRTPRVAALGSSREALRRAFRAGEVVRLRQAGVSLPARWREATRNGALRAAVFGVNDGLVSNLALIMGVVGASAGERVVVLAGLAGLLAGAFSMGAGEYVSVRAQREVGEQALAAEVGAIAEDPEAERGELAAVYRARGFSPELAERMAEEAMANPALAAEAHARDELGLDLSTLGSPVAAALSSFVTFAAGAAVPLLPFVWLSGPAAAWASIALSGATLFGVGALTSVLAARPFWTGGLRMLLIGGLAAVVTYAIGSAVGVVTG